MAKVNGLESVEDLQACELATMMYRYKIIKADNAVMPALMSNIRGNSISNIAIRTREATSEIEGGEAPHVIAHHARALLHGQLVQQ